MQIVEKRIGNDQQLVHIFYVRPKECATCCSHAQIHQDLVRKLDNTRTSLSERSDQVIEPSALYDVTANPNRLDRGTVGTG